MPTSLNPQLPAEFHSLAERVSPAEALVEAPRLQVIEILSYIYRSCQDLLATLKRESESPRGERETFARIQLQIFLAGVLYRRALDYLCIVMGGSEVLPKTAPASATKRLHSSWNAYHRHDNIEYQDLFRTLRGMGIPLPIRSPFRDECTLSAASERETAILVRGFKELLLRLLVEVPWDEIQPHEETHGEFLYRPERQAIRTSADDAVRTLIQNIKIEEEDLAIGVEPRRLTHTEVESS